MEIYQIKSLNFAYPTSVDNALKNISLSVNEGEFVTLCGKSGCGKTTLLRMLKPSITPFGNLSGNILYNGELISAADERTQAAEIGYVMQNPDNQIVTDKVWHELSFGLESLGLPNAQIRTRVSETASFFGIQNWFYKKTDELSGGQKQLLNLASVMVMQPKVLILDEPTSQLDPIAALDFLQTVHRINAELGTTIILSEHRLEDAIPLSDRVIVMDEGKIIEENSPRNIGRLIKNNDMFYALPAPMRVFGALKSSGEYPLTIREGKEFLEKYAAEHPLDGNLIPNSRKATQSNAAIEIRDAYFRYEKNSPDVIKNLNLTVNKGEIFAIVGGNGTGKTTAISLAAGFNRPQRGKVCINGSDISKLTNLYDGLLGVLPQNPQYLFSKKTVYLDELSVTEKTADENERKTKVCQAARLCQIEHLLDRHPYDLSGGEQQRAALAMILLKNPKILILDEPTKGMDAHFKKIFADILRQLKTKATILIVSHDIEFCAQIADRCAMFFDGAITATGTPRELFCGNSFYTTSANRMARNILPNALTADDIIAASGKANDNCISQLQTVCDDPPKTVKSEKTISERKNRSGIVFTLLFALSCILAAMIKSPSGVNYASRAVSIISAALAFICFFPQSKIRVTNIRNFSENKNSAKHTAISALLMLIAVPLTILFGIYRLNDRKYYFISLIIILEILAPFAVEFEGKRHHAREIVIISVLCALAVAGRAAFYMLPEFKPVIAIIIISAICFGSETGFLVGAVTGFVSNFFFGQGPWTPWQMFAFGTVGFICGLIFKSELLPKTKISLSVFGFFAALIIYGGIMNVASVLMMTPKPTLGAIISAFAMGLPFDLIHGASSAFFLWFISEPMIEKIERVKLKYGLI